MFYPGRNMKLCGGRILSPGDIQGWKAWMGQALQVLLC